VVGHQNRPGVAGDVTDRAAPNRDSADLGDVDALRHCSHFRHSSVLGHQKVSHFHRYLRRLGVHRL
jgi:hypothetical protein